MKKIFLIIIAVIFIFSGCDEDFLEREAPAKLTPETFYVEDNILAITAGAYAELQHYKYVTSRFAFGDIASDDCAKGSYDADFSAMLRLKHFSCLADDNILSWKWEPIFKGIGNANRLYQSTADLEIDDDIKNKILAEALFLRAFWYFEAVRTWGGVPLLTEPVELDDTLVRATEAETWAFIEDDLLFAIENLYTKSEIDPANYGRATRGAANALLVKTYLYQEKWTEAKNAALDIINSGEYSLSAKYGDIFQPNGEHGPGSIFEINFVSTGEVEAGENEGNFSIVFRNPRGAWGWGFAQPTQDLADEYEENDPRKDVTLISVEEAEEICGEEFTDMQTPFYNRKIFLHPDDRPSQYRDCPYNERIIRYADVCLMYAEACCQLGELGQAKEYLNKVRKRARNSHPNPPDGLLPDFPNYNDRNGNPYTDDQTGLLNAIYHERRVELALEGHRFYDVVRTGRGPELLKGEDYQFVEGKHEIVPIPQSEIDNSNGSIEQNDNYF